MSNSLEEQWKASRHGAWAGRGFRFQDSAACWITLLVWSGDQPGSEIVPEGLDDLTIEGGTSWTHVQVKSRGDHRGGFPITQVVKWLKEGWRKQEARISAQKRGRMVLVLERHMEGLPSTGWGKPASEVPELKTILGKQFAGSLLDRTHIVQVPDPTSRSLRLIADRLKLPQAAGWLHVLHLKRKIGETSDANASASHTARQSVGKSAIQTLLETCTATVDRDSLEEALRLDLCESVEFEGKIKDPTFYEGVDVKPGHVAAGLTFERPELVDQVVSGLLSKGSVLIIGPSGAGKSAALWMSAFETRHSIRWYRVKSARNEDVEALVRFAKAARPTPDAPVAFAVDPAGGPDTSGWDRLVVEAQHVPNVLVAGAVREEDFFTLESTHLSHRVRPELDRTLAESLWRVSASEGLTSWSGWREPFDHSKALLLEYMHILTRGHRLEDTLRNQVDRRLKESQDLELRALRLVATAHALGGTIPVQVIARLLVAEDEDLQRALARLIDEHLIYQDKSGRLLGLHQVRSEALLRLTHRYPPPTAAMTIEHLVRSLDGSELRAMVPSAFAFEVASDNEILSAAADRLRRDPRLSLLCDLVEATGLEDCRRLALKWVRTLEKSGLPKVQWGDAVFLAGSNVDLPDIFSVPIRTVVHEMSAQTPPDTLRKELVDRLNRPFWREVLRVDPNAAELTRALRCLSHTSLPPTALTLLRAKAHILADLPVEEIGEALSAARAVDRGLADGLVECLGGTEYLLRRIEQELPWCRNLSILEGEKGVEVQGTYRYVAPSAQTDPHKEVIRLSETVFSCLPSVEVVQVKPVDAVGSPAEYLHPDLGQKRIPRPNIPDDTAVAWNRLQ